jgi:uncharacterized cupredoxin-like copper-binding protein
MWIRTPLMHAQMSEDGGWTPDAQSRSWRATAFGFTSDDVMHGFAVGQMDMQSVNIEPGKVTDVTLTFDKPGVYTFYCTRWCSVNHWRMRGTIEVTGASSDTEDVPVNIPLYVSWD